LQRQRFAPERTTGRHRFAYIPFGGGPRVCIGNQFALTEAQLILATILPRYQFRLLPEAKVVPEPLITLRPRGGLCRMIITDQSKEICEMQQWLYAWYHKCTKR
jgi:cytochrome P450